jgi:hypothetical protein
MRPLFTSYACDYCDGLAEPEYDRGYIVLQGAHQLGNSPFYLFRTRTDAALWRSSQDLQDFPIVEVLTECNVRWRMTSGSLEGVELADRPFTIYWDHKFPPGPYRGFLSQAGRAEAAA